MRIVFYIAALALIAFPTYAEPLLSDAGLIELMTGDNPDDDLSVIPDDDGDSADDESYTGTPSNSPPVPPQYGVRQEDLDLEAKCGGFDGDKDEADPCSGWFVVETTCDPDDGCEPSYFNCTQAIHTLGKACTGDALLEGK